MDRRVYVLLLGLLSVGGYGCRAGGSKGGGSSPAVPEGWSVTAWGERYEVFAETGPLVAGASVTSNAHVTVLSGFAPLNEGGVTLILRGPAGAEEVFRQERPKREGIYPIEVKPRAEGTFDLVFRIVSSAGPEELTAGRVRVGSAASPGGRVAEESPAEGVPFLKEQQWRTQFATAWVREGTLAESVKGPAHVKPASGGEVVLTAGVDATIAPSPWPHTGLDVAASATVFRLVPRVGDRSLPELRADASSLEGEADVARRRVERLTELLQVEGTSQAELERARATLTSLEARLAGARGGVAAASNAAGSESPAAIPVRAPWAGRVAEVSVSPGQTVAAGAQLGRLVKARPLWIVVALRPEQATQVQTTPQGLFLKRPGQEAPVEIAAKGVRLISRSPEVDARTASVNVILEVDRSASELPLGSAVEAELLLAGEKRGIVVPLSALLDDSGTTVAYVQLEGESFARREVRVLGRLGSEALVEGLRPGERLVTQGAGAVRRSSLLSAGAPEGHVH
jgi:RND family efflux transporter MFP subunit